MAEHKWAIQMTPAIWFNIAVRVAKSHHNNDWTEARVMKLVQVLEKEEQRKPSKSEFQKTRNIMNLGKGSVLSLVWNKHKPGSNTKLYNFPSHIIISSIYTLRPHSMLSSAAAYHYLTP